MQPGAILKGSYGRGNTNNCSNDCIYRVCEAILSPDLTPHCMAVADSIQKSTVTGKCPAVSHTQENKIQKLCSFFHHLPFSYLLLCLPSVGRNMHFFSILDILISMNNVGFSETKRHVLQTVPLIYTESS